MAPSELFRARMSARAARRDAVITAADKVVDRWEELGLASFDRAERQLIEAVRDYRRSKR